MKEIEIENGLIVKLPSKMKAEHDIENLGYTVYFSGYYTYIPYNVTKLRAEEIIKNLMLASLKTVKKVEDYLIKGTSNPTS